MQNDTYKQLFDNLMSCFNEIAEQYENEDKNDSAQNGIDIVIQLVESLQVTLKDACKELNNSITRLENISKTLKNS
jgi:hypothetical protein